MGRTCTLKGNPLSLAGEALTVGQTAPDATLRKDLVSDYKLSEANGSVRIISVVPSLDTGVCAEQTKRFNEEAVKLPNVKFFTISTDLPMAQGRFCGAEGIDAERIVCLSDHKDIEFGNAYGTLILDLRVECRAVFVIDANNVIQYAEYVGEVTEHPDYDAILACVKGL